MNNLLISVVYLIVTFCLTLIFYKKMGKFGIYLWICISVIISNIQTIKISEILGFSVSLGNISYGSIFLSTDILSEIYGESSTNKAIKLSFVIMIIFTVLMWIFLQYIPSSSDFSQESLNTIFAFLPRVSLGSLVAYYISQNIDAKLYCALKSKFNKIYISNNVSTFVSQIIDTIIFSGIAFLGIMTFSEIVNLIVTMLIFKWMIALLDTPFMLIVPRIKPNELK